MERYLKIIYLLKSLRNWRGHLLLYFAILIIVFTCVAFAQYCYVQHQVDQTDDQELAAWATKVSDEIAYIDKWDLKGYRNAVILCPSSYVISQDGLIIDIEGDIPWLFGKVQIVKDTIYDSPQTVVSSVGETWRLYAKKINGGSVVVGIYSTQSLKDADQMLAANILKFGSTIEKAASTQSRVIDFVVDYAVLSPTGELKNAYGGLPLRVNLHELAITVGKKGTSIVKHDDHTYRIYSEPIFDANKRSVGTIIISKDTTLERQTIFLQNRFNILLVIISLVISLALAIIFTARELSRRHTKLTIEEALRIGESKTVEFKSTYQWNVNQGKQDNERRLDILKSIAGLLNTDGGNLYIGVEEDKLGHLSLRGLDEDLKLLHDSKDKLQRSLHDLITERIGSEFSPFITDWFEEVQNKLCWIVDIERSPKPAFVRWKAHGEPKEQKKFYVRKGPKTSDLDNESTWHYIKNKWG